jgi:hypothetical protein
MPNKYAPLLDGFDNLASALMLAPKMAKANRIADEDRADRKKREEQALARALLLDQRHDMERGEDRAMRKEDHALRQKALARNLSLDELREAERVDDRARQNAYTDERIRESKAGHPDGASAGRPLSATELNDLNDRFGAYAESKGLMVTDPNTGKRVPATRTVPVMGDDNKQKRSWQGLGFPGWPVTEDKPVDYNEVEALRSEFFQSQGVDPRTYTRINRQTTAPVEQPKVGQPAPAATPVTAPMDTNLPTDLLGIPVVQEDQNLAKDLGVAPDNRAKFIQEARINPDPKTGVTVDDLTSQDEAVRTRALGRLTAIERKRAILWLMNNGYQ